MHVRHMLAMQPKDIASRAQVCPHLVKVWLWSRELRVCLQ